MFDVQLLQGCLGHISVKISEDLIRHDFTITNGYVEYIVAKSDGAPITKSPAELVNIKENEYGYTRSIIIRTPIFDYEIVHDESYRYKAYRSKRH